MNLDEMIRYKSLRFKYVHSNQGLTDLALKDPKNQAFAKNVCAMISNSLFDELTSTCALLDISKRSFIESAIIEAVARAQKIMEEEGMTALLSDAENPENY